MDMSHKRCHFLIFLALYEKYRSVEWGKVALETQGNSPCIHIQSSSFPGKRDTEAFWMSTQWTDSW